MNLVSTSQTLRIVLGEAKTTNDCDIVASYADTGFATFVLGANDLVSNGTTAVTVVAAPSSGLQRQVKEVHLQNNDTVSHTVTLQLHYGSTTRILKGPAVIAAGGEFLYTPDGSSATTIAFEWNAGTVDVVGAGLSVNGGDTLLAEWTAGDVRGIGAGLTAVAGTLSNTGILSLTGGTGVTISGGSTITNSGIVSLAGGTGVTISGGNTITNSGIVSLSSGTGITVSGGNTITNSGIVSLVAGSNVTISGGNTIAAASPGIGSIVAGAGISISGGNTVANAGIVTLVAGTNVTISGGNTIAATDLWNAGTVTTISANLALNAGTLDLAPTITVSDLIDTGSFSIGGTLGSVSGVGGTIYVNNGTTGLSPLIISGNTAAPTPTGQSLIQLVAQDSRNGGFSMDTFGASNFLTARRANGTQTSPTALSASSQIAGVRAMGYNGTGYSATIAQIGLSAVENFTTSANGTYIWFDVTPAGGTVEAEVARFQGTALIIGGTTVTSTEQLHVQGDAVIVGTETVGGIVINGGSVITAIGSGLTNTSGTLSASGGGGSSTLIENIQTANYTIQATDVGKLVIFNSTSAVTATYPSLATIGVGGTVDISNVNTGVVTVTVGGSNGTIDAGGTSYFLAQRQFAKQTNDGTNWATERSIGANASGAAGGVAFGVSNTVGSTGASFTAGSNNNVNNAAFVSGISNVATNAASWVGGFSNNSSGSSSVLLGNSSTISGTSNLMVANSSANSAANPFPGFGLNITISGNGGGVAVGNSLVASGTISAVRGYQANDHGNALGTVDGQQGPGGSTSAPSQAEKYTFWNINHGTIAVSLGVGGNAPSTTVVGNPGTKTVGFVRCRMVVVDRANGNGNSYFTSNPGIFSKGTTSASMAVNATLTAGGTIGSGLTLAAAPTLAADTTNGGFSIGYTPPVANTDTLWAVAWLETDVTPGIA